MNLRNIFRILSAGVVLSSLASCHNSKQVFPDYEDGVTAYFAYQYPVRTIVLGESETFDNSLDNEHKCIIYGAMGGAYTGKDISVRINVDNSLTENLYFDAEGTIPVKPLPDDYYILSSNTLEYNGNYMGGVEVMLTDKFFDDPEALKNTYVIPVVMTEVVKGDAQINDGEPLIEDETPIRTDPTYWNKTPMDYTLYCIKYVNPWDGSWLRRGKDLITENGTTTEVVRQEQYVENDEVIFLETASLNSVKFPVSTNLTKFFTVLEDGGKGLAMAQETAGENAWDAQVWYNLAEPLKANVEYTLKFKAKATSAYEGGIWYQDSTSGESQEYGPTCSYTTQWEEKTFTIKVNGSAKNKIVFNFGTFAGTLMFDDMTLTEAGSDVNLIVNGDFEDETIAASNWQSWKNLQSVGVGCVSSEKSEVYASVCDVILTFTEDGKCTVSSATEGITASGEGQFIKDGEKLSWGNKDRDGIYLNYTIDFGGKVYEIEDVLVARSREITLETYSPTYKK